MIFGSWALPTKALISDLTRTFRQAAVELSPECYSERVRRKNKGFYYTNRQLNSAIKELVTKRVKVELFFGYFLPYERQAEIMATLEYILQLRERYQGRVAAHYVPYSTDPGSLIYCCPKKYGLVNKVTGLADYIRQIERYRRQANTENMLLSLPRQFSRQRARYLHQLIQAVCLLENNYPGSSLVFRRTLGGSYRPLINWLYRRLQQKNLTAYYLDPAVVGAMLVELARKLRKKPGYLEELIAFEAAR
jgi:hypothetical protein